MVAIELKSETTLRFSTRLLAGVAMQVTIIKTVHIRYDDNLAVSNILNP